MRWLFHFAEFSVSKHPLLEARQRCRGFSLLSTHRGDGKRYVVRADGKLTALLELDSAVQRPKTEYGTAGGVRLRLIRPRSYRPQARFLGNSVSLNRSESRVGLSSRRANRACRWFVFVLLRKVRAQSRQAPTISGKQLPPPAPKFGGVIKNDALQSKAWWAPRVVPPKDAPNILLIMTDDAGFGVPSTFGGVIPTPTMDRIAANGLRYNRIFSTALCSPTRAALITGRNHHSVGFGVIAEQAICMALARSLCCCCEVLA
jgi:Sulfatase